MIILEMKRHFEARAIEWWSAGCLATWGSVVLLTPGLFETPTYRPFFNGMLLWAPQAIWGMFAFTMGIARCFALLINGFWFRTPQIRLAASFLSVCVWFFLTAGLFKAGAIIGVAVYGWHMFADIYSSFRSGSDVVEAAAAKKLRDMTPEVATDQSHVRLVTER